MMMSEKQLSSPSSNSAGFSLSSTGSETNISNHDKPYLEITKHPPLTLYSNECFKVDVELMLPPKSSSPPSTVWNLGESLEITASLHHAKSGKPVQDEAILMTKPMRIKIPSTPGGAVGGDNNSNNTIDEDGNGKICGDNKTESTKRSVTVECMIRTDSIRRDVGSAYVVRFRTFGDDSMENTSSSRNNTTFSSPARRRAVKSASTRPVKMVNYKIRVTVDEEWESVWYKDEGGRDKSMEVFVAIYDKDGQLKTGEHIPLEPVLCYKVDDEDVTPSKVANQEILRTLGSSKILIDKDTGRGQIRYRVEEVSKNHQGKNFILQLGPDHNVKGYKDIAAAFTPAVNVRSKRNKRSRGPSSSSLPRSTAARQSASGVKSNHDLSTVSPSATRRRISGSYGGGGGGGVRGGGEGQETLQATPGNQNVSLNPTKSCQLQHAIKCIISWADEVVNGLYPMQWQVLGYQQNFDGSPDYARPYHQMPNPNSSISQILTSYTDQVRGNLRILLNAVEEAHVGNTANANVGGAATASTSADYMSSSLQGRDYASAEPYSSLMGANRFGGIQGGATALGTMASDFGMRIPGEAGGIAQTAVAGGPSGVRPLTASDGFRQRTEAVNALPYQTRTKITNNMPNSTTLPGVSETSTYPPHASMIPQQSGLRGTHHESQKSLVADSGSQEAEVDFVLAKQYKTLRCGQRLGFPAFDVQGHIIGFFREGNGKPGVGQFVPISYHAEDFGPLECMQANEILQDFRDKGSDAVHRLKDHGTIARLLDSALIYDWSKDMCGGEGASSSLQA